MGDLYNGAVKYAALRGDQNPARRKKYFYETKVFVRWLLKLLIEADNFKADPKEIEAMIMETVDRDCSRLEESRDCPDLLRRFFGTSSDSIEELLEVYGRQWLMNEFRRNYKFSYPF